MSVERTALVDAIFTVEGSILAADMFRMVFGAVTVGNQAPRVAAMWHRMHSPGIGDRVIVTDSVYGRDDDKKWKGSGILLAVEPDAEWGKAWSIKYGPNDDDICRWTNCQVLAIPTGLQDAHEALQARSDIRPETR